MDIMTQLQNQLKGMIGYNFLMMGQMAKMNVKALGNYSRSGVPDIPVKIPGQSPTAKVQAQVPTVKPEPVKKPELKKPSETRISKELKELLDPNRYSADSISENDLRHIIGQYGSTVENIYELAAGQKWMLEAAKRVKSAFFLQFLIKAVIKLDLAAFRQQADEVCRKHESLRSAFVVKGVEQPYRIILNNRVPEINCFDFSDLSMEEFDEKIRTCMETDRKRGFDLERDSLLRISIYKSCEEDTYALIISQPHINSDGTSIGIMLKDLFMGYVLDMNGIDRKIEKQSYQNYSDYLGKIDTAKELDFWKKGLNGIDEDQFLPGQQINDLDYSSSRLFVPFDDDELTVLKEAAKTYKVTQFTILQGLWGIAIARLKQRKQIVYGAITAGRDANVSDSMAIEGGFVNAIPVVINFDDDETLEDFFHSLQKNFLEYMNNSHVAPDQIREYIGRKQPIFTHLLNNQNFATPKGSGFAMGGKTGVQIIGGDLYDNLSEDLCVYITQMNGRLGCNYSYNSHAFSKTVIEILSLHLKKMIRALINNGTEGTIGMLPEADSGMIEVAQDIRQINTARIAGLLKRNPVFKDMTEDDLLKLAAGCRMESFTEDEMIIKNGERVSSLPIIVSGICTLYKQTGEGWNNPVSMVRSGGIADYSCLFEGEISQNTVVAGSSDVEVIFIPHDALEGFILQHPEIMKEISRAIYKDRKTFMNLWVNAT